MPVTIDGTAGVTAPNLTSTTSSTLASMTQALNLGSTGQIVFPATQNPSTDANTLDDYEEGSWDFAITTTSGSVTMSSTENNCWYIKIGRLVTVGGQVKVSSVSSPTGAIIVNLPFNGSNLSESAEYPAGSAAISSSVSLNAGNFTCLKQDGLEMRFYRTDVSVLASANANAQQLQANSQISFSLSYYADA